MPNAKEYSLVKSDASVLFNLTFDVFVVVTIFYWGMGQSGLLRNVLDITNISQEHRITCLQSQPGRVAVIRVYGFN